MPHDYLTVADVLGMHTVLMQRYGGLPGVRDPGALEAALFRPQTGYYDDIVAEAAALLESLAAYFGQRDRSFRSIVTDRHGLS